MNNAIRAAVSRLFPYNLMLSVAEHCQSRYMTHAREYLESISAMPKTKTEIMDLRLPDPCIDLSVIVPTYNDERYISDCVRSIQNQKTRYSYEIVIVNDGSTDSTCELIHSMADADARIRVFDQDNGGPAAARNTGLVRSCGRTITFIDADDRIEPDFIESYVTALINMDVDFVSGGYSNLQEDGRKTGSTFSREYMGTPWGRVYKREVWNDVRFPNGYSFEDTIFSYLIAPRFSNVLIHDDSYCYRHRKNSESRKERNKKSIDTYWIVEYVLAECKRLGIPFESIASELLTNACYTVFQRITQLEPEWMLPLFSAFADLWRANLDDVPCNLKLSQDKLKIAKALCDHNYRMWQILGFGNLLNKA